MQTIDYKKYGMTGEEKCPVFVDGNNQDEIYQKLIEYLDKNNIEQVAEVTLKIVISTPNGEAEQTAIYYKLEKFCHFIWYMLNSNSIRGLACLVHFYNNSQAIVYFASLLPPELQHKASQAGHC